MKTTFQELKKILHNKHLVYLHSLTLKISIRLSDIQVEHVNHNNSATLQIKNWTWCTQETIPHIEKVKIPIL